MKEADYLCSFHIDNKVHFNQQEKEQIKKDALYLFANVEPKNVHNNHSLKVINTQDNPVAIMKAQTSRYKDGTRSRSIGHYDKDRTPALSNIAQNAQVQITGTILFPKWALFHGARCKVLGIVYQPDYSPPDNLPLYVLLDIPQY